MPHTTHADQQHRLLLRAIAHRVMLERGLLPDFSKAVQDELEGMELSEGNGKDALLLESRLGVIFDGIVTGAATKGTWVRLVNLPVEGKLVEGYAGVDVGERLRVQLVEVDVDRGYIDFRKV